MTKLEKTLFFVIWIILMCSIFSNMAMENRIKDLEKENEKLRKGVSYEIKKMEL